MVQGCVYCMHCNKSSGNPCLWQLQEQTNQQMNQQMRIDTSPNTVRPWVIWTHDQHVADYVHIMVELGMSLPMGEDRSAPLVTEVLSLFSPYSLLIPSCISLLVLLYTAIYSFITTFLFIQALKKIRLANQLHSLAELLHADAIQQLEVALLGSLAATLLHVLLMSMQHQAAPL